MLKILPQIAIPPWKKNGKKLESCLRKAIFDFNLLENQTKIAIALSGGKDSLTLLFLLNAISGKGFPKLELHALHVSGEFSCGASIQENHLQSICHALQIPLHILQSKQKREKLECYSCSRERRKLIFNAAKSIGCSHIAFGHHRDDNAQTLLMNLLHKGEFAGLLPKLYMINHQITIIRPLILISENEIKTFAKEHQFERITCGCPVGQNSMRKKVDHLLTELETLFPNVRENVAHSSLLYGSDKATKIRKHRHEKT